MELKKQKTKNKTKKKREGDGRRRNRVRFAKVKLHAFPRCLFTCERITSSSSSTFIKPCEPFKLARSESELMCSLAISLALRSSWTGSHLLGFGSGVRCRDKAGTQSPAR